MLVPLLIRFISYTVRTGSLIWYFIVYAAAGSESIDGLRLAKRPEEPHQHEQEHVQKILGLVDKYLHRLCIRDSAIPLFYVIFRSQD
jgi:hypothetical protein